MRDIEFIFDFGSPNAYLVHKVISDVEARVGARITYVPALLGGIFKATGNASPMVTMAGIKNKSEYANLETERFIARHNLTDVFKFNPNFPVNSLLMMRVATAARNTPELYHQVIHCLFDAMWLEPKKMDSPEVIAEVLTQAGLPAQQLLDAAAMPENKQALINTTQSVVARGVFGSPSFFVGSELYFGKDKLRDVEEAYLNGVGV